MTWKSRLKFAGTRIADRVAPEPRNYEPPRQHNSMNLMQFRNTINYPIMRTAHSAIPYMQMATPGLSQPAWGPEINTVGAYSREGYTSRTFDSPDVEFRRMAVTLNEDEDVQLAINHLSSKVTGGEHYIKTKNEAWNDYFERFTKDLNFDTFDTILVKELLWYGNSVWKPRMGIRNIRRAEDLMHIPISSFVRIWWDRQRIPYKYEFRGVEYQGYHNPGEVLAFVWNPVDASLFGTGFGNAMLAEREFEQLTPTGTIPYRLPNMIARKLSTFFNMMLAEQRYITRNVWKIGSTDENDRQALKSQVENAMPGQDIIAGSGTDIEQLGSQARNFNPQQFMDTTQGPIFKALNDFRGKQAGTSQHTFANAKTAAVLDEIGLAAFPIAVREQLETLLFKPWYESNPIYDVNFGGGLMPVPWEEIEMTLNFGEAEKKDIPIEQQIQLMELYMNSPYTPKDPYTIEKLFEDAGLGIRKQDPNAMDQMNQPQMGTPNQMPQQQPQQQANMKPYADMGGGEVNPYQQIMGYPNFNNQNVGSPPMDNPIYDSMARDIRGDQIPPAKTLPFFQNRSNPQPSNRAQDWKYGRDYE